MYIYLRGNHGSPQPTPFKGGKAVAPKYLRRRLLMLILLQAKRRGTEAVEHSTSEISRPPCFTCSGAVAAAYIVPTRHSRGLHATLTWRGAVLTRAATWAKPDGLLRCWAKLCSSTGGGEE